MSMKHFMNKYIKFIIIAALLVCGAKTPSKRYRLKLERSMLLLLKKLEKQLKLENLLKPKQKQNMQH